MAKRTLYTVLEETVARYGAAPAMYQPTGQKSEAKRYQSFSWLEYRDAAQQIACGLRSLGIGKGDFVALHAEPSAWFYMADLGVVANGSIAAALYTSLPPSDHVRTLAAIAPKALFAEDAKTMRSLRSAGIEAPLWILLDGRSRWRDDVSRSYASADVPRWRLIRACSNGFAPKFRLMIMPFFT